MAQQSRARSLAPFVLVLASFGSAAAAEPEVVVQWNEIAQQTVAATNPFIQSRSMAITQLAVLYAATAASGSVPQAAVIAAAHAALRALHPDSAAALDAALEAGLAPLPDDADTAQAIELGEQAATRLLEQRRADGWDAKSDYVPGSGGGVWVPTPPALAPALVPQWGQVTPFALQSGAQFRPAAPAALDSPGYLEDLREVYLNGAADSASRPAELTDAARFWTLSAVQMWNPAARQASVAAQQSLAEQARTFARLNVALADALIACFDAKYTYNMWRPVTAIRGGIGDIGPAPDWLPLIATPPFPAYPSAHACAAGAASTVLERTFGPSGHALELTSAAAPGVSFRYASFKAIADQIDDARVYGGIHVREDQEVGRKLGEAVGGFVYTSLDQAG